MELANQEEEELLGVLRDVKGFLKRPEGIPSYVSKEQLFTELTGIMKSHSPLAKEKKVEAVDISGLLLKVLSGRSSRRKNSHASTDLAGCLDILLPAVICLLPSKEAKVQQSALKLVQQCLVSDQDQSKMVMSLTLDHLAANGISHKSDKIALETIKLLPGIYLQDIDVSFLICQKHPMQFCCLA